MPFVSGRRVPLIALFLATVVLAAAVPARAQGGASAVVAGVITDAQGGVLPGVTVTLRNVETGNVRTTVSEADGRYEFRGLLPGRYALTAELQGFAARSQSE